MDTDKMSGKDFIHFEEENVYIRPKDITRVELFPAGKKPPIVYRDWTQYEADRWAKNDKGPVAKIYRGGQVDYVYNNDYKKILKWLALISFVVGLAWLGMA